MTSDRQKKNYAILTAVIVVLLLACQFWIQKTYNEDKMELARLNGEVQSEKKTVESRHNLLEKYKLFETLASGTGRAKQVYPENALELFSVVDRALKDNNIEHTNRSSSSETAPGGVLQLQLSFNGQYYGILKALAALRESEYVMRVSDFKVSAGDGGRVSGSMTILSTARSQG